MTVSIIVDTGPLVALTDRSDYHHDWTKSQVAGLKPPFLTCEAVITEACFLAHHLPTGVSDVMSLLERRLVIVSLSLQDELESITKLMRRYSDLPISLADACLVRMSEQHGHSTVFTLDRHFKIYRRHGRQVVPTIMPVE